MLVVFGFVILIISFIIAFASLISEEKKQRKAVLNRPMPSFGETPSGKEAPSPIVSKEEIVKMAANSRMFNQKSTEEDLPEPRVEETQKVKKVVDQAFPWEEDDVLPQGNYTGTTGHIDQTKNRDALFGEFKISRKGE